MSSISDASPQPDQASDGKLARAPLTITVDVIADRAVIDADGELDAAGGELLCQAVAGLARDLRRVELNLCAVTAADVAGVRALEAARAAIEATGAELMIHHVGRAAYPIDARTS